MPTAMGGPASARGGNPNRRRISTAVTMRPRRLSTPAISGADKGTRVSRSGMNTSWTREIGRPKSCSPITTVTYSMTLLVTCSLKVSLIMAMSAPLRRLIPLDGRIFECSNQALAIELGDEIVEACLPSALDGGRRGDGRQRDDRNVGALRVGAQRLGEIEAVHAGHVDIGDDHVEALPLLDQGKRLLAAADTDHVVSGRLQHRAEHVAEERRVVDEQQRPRQRVGPHFFAAEPILERERQEMTDVDDFRRLALHHGGADDAGNLACNLDVELLLDDVDDLVDHQTHRTSSIREHQQRLGAFGANTDVAIDAHERHELAAVLDEMTPVGELDLLAIDLLEAGDQR